MEKTVNDLIKELQSLNEDIKKLPVKMAAQNGLLFEPKIKVNSQNLFEKPISVILDWD